MDIADKFGVVVYNLFRVLLFGAVLVLAYRAWFAVITFAAGIWCCAIGSQLQGAGSGGWYILAGGFFTAGVVWLCKKFPVAMAGAMMGAIIAFIRRR